MKKLFASLVLFAFATAAQAAEAGFTVGAVKNRVANTNGSVVQVNVKSNDFDYGLQSLNVANKNRIEVDVVYTAFSKAGFTGKVGAGAVEATNVKTHVVYLGSVGYEYDFGNAVKVGAGVNMTDILQAPNSAFINKEKKHDTN